MPPERAARLAEPAQTTSGALNGRDQRLTDADRLTALAGTRLLQPAQPPLPERYTNLARQFYRTDAALLLLADETRGVVNCLSVAEGAAVPPVPFDVPLVGAPCARVVCHGQALAVMDLQDDARFAGYELPGLATAGAYLGVPVMVEGHAVGTLCVLDTMPRVWTEADAAVLWDLAAIIEVELARRHLWRRLQSASTGFKSAGQALGLAMQTVGLRLFEWHVATDKVAWCTTLEEFLAAGKPSFQLTLKEFLRRVAVDDQEIVRSALLRAQATRSACHCIFRMHQPDDTLRRYSFNGQVMGDGESMHLRLMAAVLEIDGFAAVNAERKDHD